MPGSLLSLLNPAVALFQVYVCLRCYEWQSEQNDERCSRSRHASECSWAINWRFTRRCTFTGFQPGFILDDCFK
ncbi:MAG: hypothetical protein MUO61_00880, partial [Dehalococcoidia bacterium]|nr:hypothetical protein [Dehalococcoidia bacterium]